MPFERQRHVRARHAAAIIGNLDQVQPAGGQPYMNTIRAGIDGVFDQFLERTGGPFHDFAGGDAVYQMFGQSAY